MQHLTSQPVDGRVMYSEPGVTQNQWSLDGGGNGGEGDCFLMVARENWSDGGGVQCVMVAKARPPRASAWVPWMEFGNKQDMGKLIDFTHVNTPKAIDEPGLLSTLDRKIQSDHSTYTHQLWSCADVLPGIAWPSPACPPQAEW